MKLARTLATLLALLVALTACEGTFDASGLEGELDVAEELELAAAGDVQRPLEFHGVWGLAGTEGDPDVLAGRCPEGTAFLSYGWIEGTASHLGRVTGTTEHCSQGATYGDGLMTLTAANGDELYASYGNGVSGFDPDEAVYFYADDWEITGGTGRFVDATGVGENRGTWTDMDALLAGTELADARMWGWITYDPSRAPRR